MKQSDVFEKIVKIEDELLLTTDSARIAFLEEELSKLENSCNKINSREPKNKKKYLKM
jgi:hypothetical protein